MPVVNNIGQAFLTSLANALNLVLTFIPKFLGFLVILLVGWIVASVLSRTVTFILRRIGFERLGARVGLNRLEQNTGMRFDIVAILGTIVYWFIFLIFLVPAVDALGLSTVSNILNELIAYIPNVFVAVLVLFLGLLAASVVGDIVRGVTATTRVGNPALFAAVARYALIGFAALIALEQLQIAPSLLNILFTAVVGGTALAFGLAFGLGGQDAARRLLSRGGLLTAPAGESAQPLPTTTGEQPTQPAQPTAPASQTQPEAAN
ncbi:mechanosensitive ion channel family protein [Thermogemmatispora sp.]|uniref:mechanosensitive ion channel family protein n=1 Tax=Thermogemmatispora sp. TaxID=1968838 RepID=UPI001DC9AE81|nr:hypothetical protein [Thermogemmatispora sp.]MBX5450690.1 small-conductance mechanosensitive ion channel [Thermogemmatispora sp.]